MRNQYQVLGHHDIDRMVTEVLGDDKGSGGFDYSQIIPAVAELAQKGVQTYQSQEQAKQAKIDEGAKLQKAIAADVAWADAEAQLELANASKVQNQIAAAQALQQSAMGAAVTAGAGLSTESAGKRTTAAQDAAKSAAQAALSSPRDALKQARMHAWQKVAAAATAAAAPAPLTKDEKKKLEGGGSSFLTRYYGGVPVWGWGLGGAAVLTGVVLLVKHFKRKK